MSFFCKLKSGFKNCHLTSSWCFESIVLYFIWNITNLRFYFQNSNWYPFQKHNEDLSMQLLTFWFSPLDFIELGLKLLNYQLDTINVLLLELTYVFYISWTINSWESYALKYKYLTIKSGWSIIEFLVIFYKLLNCSFTCWDTEYKPWEWEVAKGYWWLEDYAAFKFQLPSFLSNNGKS